MMNSMVLKGFFTTPPNSIHVLVSDLQLHILMKQGVAIRSTNTLSQHNQAYFVSVWEGCMVSGTKRWRSSRYISPDNNYLYPFLPPTLGNQSTSPAKSSNLSCPKKKFILKKKKGSLTVGDLMWSPTLNGTIHSL